MPFTNTPNMGMPLPTVSSEPGPQYASDVNQCITVLDSHDHGPGNGVPIGAQSINIQSDLSFNIQDATSLRTARFVSTTATSGTDVGCVYVRGVDLFYNDLNANVVRITQSGGLSTTAQFIGNISTTAITSAAGPTPATSGFVRMNNNTDFLSWRNAGNNADDRLYFDSSDNLKVLGNVAGGVETYGVRFFDKVGNRIAYTNFNNSTSAYSLTLPPQPTSSVAPMFLNPSGTITTTQQLSRAQLPTVGQQISNSCGNFTTASASFIQVTNLSVIITTTGRPVMLMMTDDGSSAQSNYGLVAGSGGMAFSFFRNAIQLNNMAIVTGATFNFPSNLFYLDVVASSTYTYSMKVLSSGGAQTVFVAFSKLTAIEL